jgi:hypothetical protein
MAIDKRGNIEGIAPTCSFTCEKGNNKAIVEASVQRSQDLRNWNTRMKNHEKKTGAVSKKKNANDPGNQFVWFGWMRRKIGNWKARGNPFP